MRIDSRIRVGDATVLLLFVMAIVWKGGKGLEMTWLLALATAWLTLSYWWARSSRKGPNNADVAASGAANGARPDIPFGLWASVLLYAAWTMLSYVFSETKNYGLDSVVRTAALMLLFLWTARMHIDRAGFSLRRTFPTFVAAGSAVACVAGIAVYALQPVNRFVGTFFDYRFDTDYWPNAWAEFVLLAWPMVALAAWRAKKKERRIAGFFLLSLVLASLALSYSRGAILAGVGQSLVMCVLFASVGLRDIRYKRTISRHLRSFFFKAIPVCAMSVLLFLGVNALRARYHEVQSVAEKVTFTADEGTSSIDERSQFWSQAQTLTMQRPLLGHGPYSFRFTQPRLMTDVLATSDHPHNVLLQLAAERGIPAAFLFLGIVGGVLGLAILSFFTTRKAMSGDQDAFAILSIGSIVGVLLHNLIDYNLQFVAVSLGTIILLGLLVPQALPAAVGSQTASFRRWRIRKILSRCDVALASMLLIVACWEGLFLVTSSFGRHAMAAGNAQTALAWFERSHVALFSRDLYLSEAQLAMGTGDLQKAHAALEHHLRLNDHDPRGWKLLGALHLQEGRDDDAFHALTEAYERGKYTDIGILRLLLEAARRGGRQAEIAPRKPEFDALFSEYAEAIEGNVHFIALSHNVEELTGAAALLSALHPLDAEQYAAIARSAEKHAFSERQKYDARAPGMLW